MKALLLTAIPCSAMVFSAGAVHAQIGTFNPEALRAMGGPATRPAPAIPPAQKAIQDEVIAHHDPDKTAKLPSPIDPLKATSSGEKLRMLSSLRDRIQAEQALLQRLRSGKIARITDLETFPSDPRQMIVFQSKEAKEDDINFLADGLKADRKRLVDATSKPSTAK